MSEDDFKKYEFKIAKELKKEVLSSKDEKI